MRSKKNNRTLLIFYILIAYVFLQFIWWGYHIISLTKQVNFDESYQSRRILMITGEALVFVIIIFIGIVYVIRSYKKEFKLTKRHKNFTLSVTHELKTPIASSKLFAETLLNRDLPEEKHEEVIRKIIIDQERLQKLVDNILMASKVDESDIELVIEEVNARNFIQDICNSFPDSHLLINDIEKDISMKVDVFYFTSVIQNLYENAQKYSPNKTSIKWNAIKYEKQLKIIITDEGEGISESEKNKVFQLFYRIEKEETRNSKGTGLGLYLVSSIVKMHKGEVRLMDNQPKGSKFIIILNK